MQKLLSLAVLCSLVGAPMLVGCDKKLADEESVKVKDDGTVVKDKKEVSEKPNGDVVKEESHTVNH